MLDEVYDVAMERMQVYKWHKHFCDGHVSVSDDGCSK
jgi:formylmethanofuran dehydrogenase subunit E-like metal-binding protein